MAVSKGGFSRQPAEVFSVATGDGKQSGGTVYIFDVSFLLSGYTCTYGCGCKGMNGVEHVGCCQIGAHYMNKEDEAKVRHTVALASEDDFTNGKEIMAGRHTVRAGSKTDGEWDMKTRVINDKCIFLNDPSHPNGAGCGLHQVALRMNGDPIDYKPSICSWVPLNVVCVEEAEFSDTSERVYVGRFEHEDWGGREDQPLTWFCLDDLNNFPQNIFDVEPLYLRMQRELLEIVEGDQDVMRKLNQYLDARHKIEKDAASSGHVSVVQITQKRRPPIGDGSIDGSPTWNTNDE